MHRVLAISKERDLIAQIGTCLNCQAETETISTTSYLDFIEAYINRYTSLLILDVDLLREDVVRLIKILRSLDKNCTILLLLSPENMPLCSRVLAFGKISYLIKPIAVQRACNLIASTLKIALPNENIPEG